jgi:hypothetical protein
VAVSGGGVHGGGASDGTLRSLEIIAIAVNNVAPRTVKVGYVTV